VGGFEGCADGGVELRQLCLGYFGEKVRPTRGGEGGCREEEQWGVDHVGPAGRGDQIVG